MENTGRDDFLTLIGRPDEAIDLAEAALLMALQEYPDLDISAYLGALDRLADEAASAVGNAGPNPFAIVDALNTYLFKEKGFSGNTEEYFDPRNSYLNEVLDRRILPQK